MPDITPPVFDSLALAAVAAEIHSCVGAHFGGVRQPAADALVLSLGDREGRHHLFFSIHPRTARVHFTRSPEATERLGAFGQLLRSRLPEARLEDVEQPPFDRVLRLRFGALRGPVWLVAEVMGRHSNLILSDTRVVLGALKIVTPQMSPRRPMLPGRPYLPPPADRPRPTTIDLGGMRALLTGQRPLWQQLSHSLLGLSPLLAREIAARSGLDPATSAGDAAASADRIWAAVREITTIREEERWSPTLYLDDSRIVAFSPFPLRLYEGLRPLPTDTMSDALDRYYRGVRDEGPLEDRRRALTATVRAALGQREKVLLSTRQALAESQTAERFRVMGDLLLTYGARVSQRDEALTVPDHTAGGALITIPLDPRLTPVENAQRFFRRYAKAQAASRALPPRIAHLESETLALREALMQIASATSLDDLWEIHTDLAARELLLRAPRSRPVVPGGPRRFETEDGASILVGRSARENDYVTFHLAGPDDLWFHARGLPGAHVVLKGGADPADASIATAAQTAAYFSEGREGAQVAVDCVARKHVRKPRGAPPGAVTYEGERTLRVAPALPARSAAPAPALRSAPQSRPRRTHRSR